MLWRIWQLVVIVAVLCLIIYDGTLSNGYAAGFAAFMAAWFATAVPLWLIDRWRSWTGKGTPSHLRQSGTAPVRSYGLSQWLEEPAPTPRPSRSLKR